MVNSNCRRITYLRDISAYIEVENRHFRPLYCRPLAEERFAIST